MEQRAPRRRRAARGFSTLEVLISSALLSAVMVGMASALPTASRNVHLGGQNSKAVALAQQMLETIRNDTFSQLSLYNGPNGQGVDTRDPATFPADTPNPPVPGNPGNFQGGTNLARWGNDIQLFLGTGAGITGGYGTVRVQSVAQDGSGNTILERVTVTVFWAQAGRERSVRLDTLVSGI